MKRSVAFLILALLAACSPAKDASDAARATATSGVASNQTAAGAVAATATPAPATAAAAKRQLTITAFGFGVEPSSSIGSLGYGFTIRNENAAEAAESVSVQIAFTDASGTVVDTASQSIAYIGPSEHIGLAGSSYPAGGKIAAKMTVQALPSKWTAVAPLPGFSFTNVTFIPDKYFSKVTGIIKSPFGKDYKNVRISAIGVDANGQIVGGGFTYQEFVPANGTAAASVSYTGVKPANVVLYGQLSSLSLLTSP